MDSWVEYADTVRHWDDYVADNPCAETFKERWQARIRHPSWAEKREALLWLCQRRCERCGCETELELHHLHYDSLWYESHQDLEVLCKSCHWDADRERADMQASLHQHLSVQARAYAYMEIANRRSGQPDWPVSYEQALKRVQKL